ncbi:hypothetical protein GF324_13120 [bacterium]|nr:hypothetical protein [bacterium]
MITDQRQGKSMHTDSNRKLVFKGLELAALRQLLGPLGGDLPGFHAEFVLDELEIDVDDLQRQLTSGEAPVLVDIREPDELSSGMLEDARHVRMNEVVFRLGEIAADKTSEMVLYCRSGHRSLYLAAALQLIGYGNVRSLRGGIRMCQRYGMVRRAS